jgi:Zn-dependent protease
MFRLFGFDVHVRAGFVVFLALIVFLYQDEFGLWLAGGIAGFTLLHELGHATAARSAGAEASISLDFLAGYTSYRERADQQISRPERALITAAGPVVQIVVSVGVLAAMGVNPLSFDSIRDSGDAAAALWWAGPMIGALNLIPVLPLDGGHLALTGLESFLGDKALRTMAIASLVLTVGGALVMFASGRGDFAIFVAFLIISQLQLLGATGSRKSRPRNPIARLTAAENTAWQTGRPGMLEPGQRVSPWFEAHRALTVGDADGARRAIVNDLQSERPARWAAPAGASAEQLRAVVDVLPERLPHGNPYSERVLADVLLATGHYARAGQYAVESYPNHRSSTLATVVARAAAAMGDEATALQWLQAAVDDADHEADHLAHLLGVVMDRAAEFAALRSHPAYTTLRARLP